MKNKNKVNLKIHRYINSKGDTLPLSVIVTKRIVSITIGYIRKEEKPRINGYGLSKLSILKKKIDREAEVTITDQAFISLYLEPGEDLASIRFSFQREYDQVSHNDENTISKFFFKNEIRPYQFSFPLENIKKIDWE